ncbi:hypothetical protein ACJX0J_018411, partial [Zea mays]
MLKFEIFKINCFGNKKCGLLIQVFIQKLPLLIVFIYTLYLVFIFFVTICYYESTIINVWNPV